MNNPLYLLSVDAEDATDLLNLLLDKKVPCEIGISAGGMRYNFIIETVGLEEKVKNEIERYVSALKRWRELA